MEVKKTNYLSTQFLNNPFLGRTSFSKAKWEWVQRRKYRVVNIICKGLSFCKQCMQDLQFMKTRSSSPNHSKLARADISCQFMKTRWLFTKRIDFINKWQIKKSRNILAVQIRFKLPTSIQTKILENKINNMYEHFYKWICTFAIFIMTTYLGISNEYINIKFNQ